MQVNQGTIQTLNIGFNALFNRVMGSAQDSWNVFANRASSNTRRNEYAWMRNIPQMKRSFGPLVLEDLIRKAYQVPNHRFDTGFHIEVDDIEDENLGGYDLSIQATLQDAAEFTGRACANLLPHGLPGGKGKSFDEVTFFSTAHPLLKAGETYSNVDAGGGGAWWYLLDTRMGIMPLLWQDRKPIAMTVQNMPTDNSVFEDNTVRWKIQGRQGFGYTFPQLAYASNQTLDAANLEAAHKTMMKQLSDDGRKLGIMPNLLVVGPENAWPARRLLENERDAAGATNVFRGKLDLHISQYVEEVTIDDLLD